MRPVKLGVSEGYILSQTYKSFSWVSEKAYWGMKVKLLCIIVLKKEKNIMMVYYSYLLKRISDLIGLVWANRLRRSKSATLTLDCEQSLFFFRFREGVHARESIKDLFDLIGLVLFTEREGTGSNYLANKANWPWVMICYLVEKKMPLGG